ncbi:MAG: acyltransferase, partial [Methanobacteriota archaeon]
GVVRLEKGRLSISSGSWFEKGVLLHCIDGHLSIGEMTFINKNSVIACMESITIGNNVLIADHVSIFDHDHGLVNRSEYRTKPVLIEDNVWLGSHSVVLKGVRIGKGSIVAAGSVVTKSIPPNEIWGGVPARFMKKIEP